MHLTKRLHDLIDVVCDADDDDVRAHVVQVEPGVGQLDVQQQRVAGPVEGVLDRLLLEAGSLL